MKISIKAVLIALTAGVILDIILGYSLLIYFIAGLPENWSEAQAVSAVLKWKLTTDYLVKFTIINFVTSAIAGYLVAHIAKTKHLLHAAVIGLLSICVTLIYAKKFTFWLLLLGIVSTIIGVLLGGYLCMLRQKKSS